MARRPGAAPDPQSFGGSAAQAGARRVSFIAPYLIRPARTLQIRYDSARITPPHFIVVMLSCGRRLKRTNTAANSKSSHPLVFTADLSVFEAHLLLLHGWSDDTNTFCIAC